MFVVYPPFTLALSTKMAENEEQLYRVLSNCLKYRVFSPHKQNDQRLKIFQNER